MCGVQECGVVGLGGGLRKGEMWGGVSVWWGENRGLAFIGVLQVGDSRIGDVRGGGGGGGGGGDGGWRGRAERASR